MRDFGGQPAGSLHLFVAQGELAALGVDEPLSFKKHLHAVAAGRGEREQDESRHGVGGFFSIKRIQDILGHDLPVRGLFPHGEQAGADKTQVGRNLKQQLRGHQRNTQSVADHERQEHPEEGAVEAFGEIGDAGQQKVIEKARGHDGYAKCLERYAAGPKHDPSAEQTEANVSNEVRIENDPHELTRHHRHGEHHEPIRVEYGEEEKHHEDQLDGQHDVALDCQNALDLARRLNGGHDKHPRQLAP